MLQSNTSALIDHTSSFQEGKNIKFLKDVEQITFNGKFAAKGKQPVLFITERCVFQLNENGLELTEIAPGIDIEKDILPGMEFSPIINDPKPMTECIFFPESMCLKDQMLSMSLEDRISYSPAINTIFLNFAGLRVRTEKDIADIHETVESRMKAIGKRMHSIVNYDSFVIDEDVMDHPAILSSNLLVSNVE